LLLLIGIVAVLLGIWVGWIRKEITVRPARAEDRLYQRYFGIDEEGARVRNIVIAKGTFTKSTWLSAALYLVQSGAVQEVNAFTVGRSPNRIGDSIWETMEITLALGDRDTSNGRLTHLGSAGQTRGGGRRGELTHAIAAKYSASFTGRITPGREYVIHVEGDTDVRLDRETTLDEFLKRSSGNHLVVVARLN
jgi:hypothetical protein